jgi:hypothetical protein
MMARLWQQPETKKNKLTKRSMKIKISYIFDLLSQGLKLETLGTPLLGFKFKSSIIILTQRVTVAIYVTEKSSILISAFTYIL